MRAIITAAFVGLGAWLTHVIVCLSTYQWGFLIAGAIFFPIAIIHGIGIWLGIWPGNLVACTVKTKIIEATNIGAGGVNWGKFLVGRFDHEWDRRSYTEETPVYPLLRRVGWGPEHLLVMDLQTGEGAIFRPGGRAKADLIKHRVWVCPLFENFLTWLYRQDLRDLDLLPEIVAIDDPTSAMYGYRRPGPDSDT